MSNPALISLARLAVTRETLKTLTATGNAETIGRKALLLAFLIAPEAIGTQRVLAARLGVTEARTSQMLKPIRRHFKL